MAVLKSLDDLKAEYIGKVFGFLTVTNILRDESHCKWLLTCQCKCGNIVNKQLNAVTSGHTVSCGCYTKSKEFADKRKIWCANNRERLRSCEEDRVAKIKQLKDEYVGKSFNRLTVNDITCVCSNSGRIKHYNAICTCACGKQTVTRLYYVLSGHTKSCGCCSRSEALIDYWSTHKDDVISRAKKHSEWCKNNPDKVAEQGRRHSEWFKNNHDKLLEIIRKGNEWRLAHQSDIER